MQINKLTDNIIQVSNIFNTVLLTQIIEINYNFVPETIRIGDNAMGKRETYMIRGKLKCEILDNIKNFTQNSNLLTTELWRDLPGYSNKFHYDDDIVSNAMIIYLDNNYIQMGTEAQDNGITYRSLYQTNSRLIILNSNKILHGMIGVVSDNTIRRVLYILEQSK